MKNNKEYWCPMCGVVTFPVNPKKGEDCYCEECTRILNTYNDEKVSNSKSDLVFMEEKNVNK